MTDTFALPLPGDQFIINGSKIKVAGEAPDIGVYFVPIEDPFKAIKVTRIAENSSSKIIDIAPNTEQLYNRIEIHTQYSGANDRLLKNKRVITRDFTLELA